MYCFKNFTERYASIQVLISSDMGSFIKIQPRTFMKNVNALKAM